MSERKILNTKNPELDPSIRPVASLLKQVAFKSIKEGNPYIDQEEIEEIASEGGIETSRFQKLGIFKVEDDQGSFIHQTFREFFAAKYIADLYLRNKTTQAQKILRKYKFNGRFRLVLRMVGGYLSLKGKEKYLQEFFNDLFDKPRDHAIRYELNLLAGCF